MPSLSVMNATLLRIAVAALALATATGRDAPRTVRARLVYLDPPAADFVNIHCAGKDGAFTKVTPALSVSGAAVACPVDEAGTVTFTKIDAPEPVVATGSVPAGVKDAIFFLWKDPRPAEGAPPYRLLAVDEGAKAVPNGGSFVANLGDSPARITLGDAAHDLAAGQSTVVPRPAGRDEHNMASLLIESEMAGKWSRLKDALMRYAEADRYFILLVPAGEGKRPAVKIYKQVVN